VYPNFTVECASFGVKVNPWSAPKATRLFNFSWRSPTSLGSVVPNVPLTYYLVTHDLSHLPPPPETPAFKLRPVQIQLCLSSLLHLSQSLTLACASIAHLNHVLRHPPPAFQQHKSPATRPLLSRRYSPHLKRTQLRILLSLLPHRSHYSLLGFVGADVTNHGGRSRGQPDYMEVHTVRLHHCFRPFCVHGFHFLCISIKKLAFPNGPGILDLLKN
jgi:hypothetical protein